MSYGVVDTAQKSPYECGFAPFQSGRHPFSLYFFLVALIFIIFDVELVILLPLPLLGDFGLRGLGVFLFLWVLLIGLYHEWREGRLDWPVVFKSVESFSLNLYSVLMG